MTSTERRQIVRGLWPLIADLLCVLALALGGMRSHEPDDSDLVVLAIAWPYAVSAASAHAWLLWRGARTSRPWPEGAIILAVTYVLGMTLRAVSGRGLAPAFLVVAGAVLALTVLGWRAAAQFVTRRRVSLPRRT